MQNRAQILDDLLTHDKGRLSSVKGVITMNETKPDISVVNDSELITAFHEVEEFLIHSKSENTRRAYKSDWKRFNTWCEASGYDSMPALPGTITFYIVECANQGLKTSTIDRYLVSISQAHKMKDYESPTKDRLVRETLKGIKNKVGTAPTQKRAVAVSQLRAMVSMMPRTPCGYRDAAMLLLGFAGGFRRSELTALNWEDVQKVPEGMKITIRRSKTDQTGEGRPVGIPMGRSPITCPVMALENWKAVSEATEGPIFRTVNRWGAISDQRAAPQTVSRVIKKWAELAGLNPEGFAGHSLRAGLATEAAAAGKSERSIMNTTGHRTERMVRRYIREGSLFLENAAEGLL